MTPFHRVAESDFLAVNQMIVEQLHSDVDLVENIGHYIVDGGGKRLRPLVVLLSALSAGITTGNAHIKLACIIEFIHTATLLHDDVVDKSDLRRGRLTANAKWDNGSTVLVGDFLYSRAFQIMVELGDLNIMKLLANTTNTIAEGEVQQLINAGNPDVSESDYLDVIHKKTAILFDAACSGGAIIAGNDSLKVKAMSVYGHHLGMVFQLQDDLLDYTGDVDAMGKNLGDDLAEGKPTLPLIQCMRCADNKSASLIRDAIRNRDSSRIGEIVKAVSNSGGLDYTREMAVSEANSAKAALATMASVCEPANNIYLNALSDLADFALDRSY